MTSVDFFDLAQRQYKSQLPFVVYKHPNSDKIKGMFQSDNTLQFVNDFTESGFVFAPFDNLKKTVLFPSDLCECLDSDFEIQENDDVTINESEASPQKQAHIALIDASVEAIKNNQFEKVVVSRGESVKYTQNKPIDLFKKLINSYGEAFVYCWFHPKIGLWIGATPENFVNINGRHCSTMALAGTELYADTLNVDWGEKEKEEQQIVVKSIEASLSKYVVTIEVSKPKTVKAGGLVHIQSVISGRLKTNQSIAHIINELHPTPAVCGFPKKIAKQFILENENYDREYYTGFLGELNLMTQINRSRTRRNIENNAYSTVKKVTNLFVNLRCLQLKEDNAIIYVGGGITKDSSAMDEWQETVYKTETMKRVLN